MAESSKLKLPFLTAGQSQKHVTVNEGLRIIDVLAQIVIIDRDLTAPPGSPSDGDTYIAASGATGAWASGDLNIFAYLDGAWTKFVPVEGWLAWIADENALVGWNGSAWANISSLIGAYGSTELNDGTVTQLGVNRASDATNKLAVRSNAIWFDALNAADSGNGDVSVKIDKEATADTGSILFQVGASGRGELGLTGTDDLTCKVSPDGATWYTSFTIDKDTGFIGIGRTDPGEDLDIRGTDPAILLSESSAADLRIEYNSSLQSKIIHRGPTTALLDISVTVEDGTSQGTVRMFRETNSTGLVGLQIHRGNNTSALNHTIAGNAATLLDQQGFKVKIGSAGSPACALDVEGPVRVKSYTVAGVPAASAAAGQIIYVSNETGGATLAFSDGTNWRRVQDRAVVS